MELSEEEKKAIEWLKKAEFFSERLYAPIILNLIDNQQKEIEEKTTILLAGAEKVKQLEKGNRSLMESRIKWKNRYYKEKAKNKDCISKDKIREKLNYFENSFDYDDDGTSYELVMKVLEELLEENNEESNTL